MNKVLDTVVRLRRDTEENYEKIKDSFIPASGELCLVDIEDNKLAAKVGDGESSWNELDLINLNIREDRHKVGDVIERLNQTPDEGWHLCDGTPIPKDKKLHDMVPYTFGREYQTPLIFRSISGYDSSKLSGVVSHHRNEKQFTAYCKDYDLSYMALYPSQLCYLDDKFDLPWYMLGDKIEDKVFFMLDGTDTIKFFNETEEKLYEAKTAQVFRKVSLNLNGLLYYNGYYYIAGYVKDGNFFHPCIKRIRDVVNGEWEVYWEDKNCQYTEELKIMSGPFKQIDNHFVYAYSQNKDQSKSFIAVFNNFGEPNIKYVINEVPLQINMGFDITKWDGGYICYTICTATKEQESNYYTPISAYYYNKNLLSSNWEEMKHPYSCYVEFAVNFIMDDLFISVIPDSYIRFTKKSNEASWVTEYWNLYEFNERHFPLCFSSSCKIFGSRSDYWDGLPDEFIADTIRFFGKNYPLIYNSDNMIHSYYYYDAVDEGDLIDHGPGYKHIKDN